jgi:hypothetical protein
MIFHKTSHPRIIFAKGNLFSKESLSCFDGILAFAEGFTGINRSAYNAVNNGLIKCPYRIHGIESFRTDTSITKVNGIVQSDLCYLAEQGCRNIGIHIPDQMDRAKTALRAALEWLNDHTDVEITLTFVDLRDDYYNCFGLESFDKERSVCNPSPTPFESYYENDFKDDLVRAFGRIDKMENHTYHFVEKGDVAERLGGGIFFHTYFSVGLFFTNLIPQAIAKVTGNVQDLYDFSSASGMPLLDRYMLGSASSYTILADTGMLPKENDYAEWFSLARMETPYFVRVLTHYILDGIQKPRKAYAVRLSRLDSPVIKKVCKELTNYLDAFEESLKNDIPLTNSYLSESFFKNNGRGLSIDSR